MSTSRSQRAVRSFIAMLFTLVANACRDVAPTSSELPIPVSAARVEADLPDEAIADILNRVLPALVDDDQAQQLHQAFQAIFSAVSLGPGPSVSAALDRAERVVQRYADVTSAADDDAVHLDVMTMALAALRNAM